MSKNKTAAAIALFLILTIAVTIVALPTVNAQAGTQKTYFVFGATPNPVGVNQEIIILVGITQQLYSALYGWNDLSITITRPDGIVETISDIRTDSTGLTGRNYRPTMAGNYTLVGHFPEQVIEPGGGSSAFGGGIPDGTVMEASDSDPVTLVVQEEPIEYYPTLPLPTEYWTRPIDDQLREWAPIAGNWLTTPRNFLAIGNDDAPETAHILWAKPLTSGGLVGGALSGLSASDEDIMNYGYETGDAYEGKWGSALGTGAPIIMGGKIYYEVYAANDRYKKTACVDLHTGEELWAKTLVPNLNPTRGQLMFWHTYDNQGVYDYLWVAVGGGFDMTTFTFIPANLTAFDPFNGDEVYTLYGLPSGTFDYGPNGELLYYTVDQTHGYMLMWNSTNIPDLYAGKDYASMAWGQWQPMGKTVNATGVAGVTIGAGFFGFPPGVPYTPYHLPTGLNGYQWNVTIPTGLPGSVQAAFTGDKIVGARINQTHVIAWALNLNESEGDIGDLLYNEAWSAPDDWLDGNQTISFGAISNIDDVFTVNAKESRLRYGFSTENGKYKWVISEPIAMLGHLTGGPSGENGYIVYGKLICGTMSGVIQAYDVTDGQLAWSYDARDPHMQVLWSNNFPVGHLIAADGKIYFANLEHSVNQPIPRGGPFVCLNATTGEVIFRADGLFRSTVWGGRAAIGDSIIATMDTYDQRVYAIGKGPSATTVSAGPKTTVLGTSVVVEGMVTDTSPGTEEYGLRARFPNGVPAVADENQSDWMLYVYKQFARPTDVTGVEVVIEVMDPNNNPYEVGRATSDASGFFHCAFTPPVPGEYTIIATFAGSNAYYGSFAETAITVDDVPAETPPPTPTPAPMTDTYVLGIGTAAIIAIVLIGLIIILMLRRR
jgi:hypothetical protein